MAKAQCQLICIFFRLKLGEENDEYDSVSSIDNIVAKIKQTYSKAVVSVVKPLECKNPSIDYSNTQTLNQCLTLNFEVLDETLIYDNALGVSECFDEPFLPSTSFENKVDSDFPKQLPSSSNQNSFSGRNFPP